MSILVVRENDVDKILSKLLPVRTELPRSMIVQGLPGSGCEYIFGQVIQRLKTDWCNDPKHILITLNLTSYWIYPVTQLVKEIISELNSFLEDPVSISDTDIDTLLFSLRDAIVKCSRNNRMILFGLDNFDSLLKFNDPVGVQHFLNTFQTVGYDPSLRSSFIIKCNRDIEDICRVTNYSDFHKIFGQNQFKVIGKDKTELINLLIDSGINKEKAEQVVQISARNPEHIQLILETEFDFDNLDVLSTERFKNIFDEWVDCLSLEELRVITLIINNQKLDNGDFFSKNKLLSKGVIEKNEGNIKLTHPLFQIYFKNRFSEPRAIKTGQFVRRSSRIDSKYLTLIKQLLPEMEYIECEIMQQPRPDEAVVYMVSGEDNKGSSIRPCIIKIHTSESIDNEIAKTEKARLLLGPVVPVIKGSLPHQGLKAVMFEFATADNKNYEAKQFGKFYEDNSTKDVVDIVEKLFIKTLYPLYKNFNIKSSNAKNFYALPKILLGEYDYISNIFKALKYYDSLSDTVSLFGKFYHNPGNILRPTEGNVREDYFKLFINKRKIGISAIHNDLNPRNILIDGIGNIHVIDFAVYKEDGARFSDIVHLEVSVKFKLHKIIDEQGLMQSVSLEKLLVDSLNLDDLESICQLPLSEEYLKMVSVIRELRRSGLSLGECEVCDFDIEYKTALLAHTLRIILYDGYLSDYQKSFAILSASFLHKYLIEKC